MGSMLPLLLLGCLATAAVHGASAGVGQESWVAREVDDVPRFAALAHELGRELPTRENLEVEVPRLPGDIGLCGRLPPESVELVAKPYASWVYLNLANDSGFLPRELELAGVQHVEVRPFFGPASSERQLEMVMEAMDRLPRPLMLQCTCGNRAGLLLLLWLARAHGYSRQTAAKMGKDLDLKCFTRCSRCGGMRRWLLGRLPAEGATPSPGLALRAGSPRPLNIAGAGRAPFLPRQAEMASAHA